MKPHGGVLVSLFELVIKYTIKVAFFYLLKFWEPKESTLPLIYNLQHFSLMLLRPVLNLATMFLASEFWVASIANLSHQH